MPLGRLPHAVQRLGHARPALSPVRCFAGPRYPWSSLLGSTALRGRRCPGFVRRLHSYYGGVRTSPDRASAATAPDLPAADHLAQGAYGRPRDLPGSRTRSVRACQVLRPRRAVQIARAGASEHIAFRYTDSVGFDLVFYRGSMAGLPVPLPTLRRRPHERLRTAWGRCGLLLLHRRGLAPPTPCRSPGAPVRKHWHVFTRTYFVRFFVNVLTVIEIATMH